MYYPLILSTKKTHFLQKRVYLKNAFFGLSYNPKKTRILEKNTIIQKYSYDLKNTFFWERLSFAQMTGNIIHSTPHKTATPSLTSHW